MKLHAADRRILEAIRAIVNVAKDSIPAEQVHRTLPFPTRKEAGNNYNHLVNDSIYPVTMERRTVRPDEACADAVSPPLVSTWQDLTSAPAVSLLHRVSLPRNR